MPRQNVSRDKIIDAAIRVFSKSGYHHASMDDIAADAGVAKGTLYYNFPNKASLFLAIVRDGLDHMKSAIEKELQSERPADQQTAAIIRFHIDTYLEYPQLIRIMFNELSGGLDAELRGEVTSIRREYSEFIEGLLEYAETSSGAKSVDRKLMSHVLIDLFFSTVLFADENPGVSGDDIYSFLKTLLYSGIFRGDLK